MGRGVLKKEAFQVLEQIKPSFRSYPYCVLSMELSSLVFIAKPF